MTVADIETIKLDELQHIFNSKTIVECYMRIPEYVEDWDEVKLAEKAKPTKADWKLRVRLWDCIEKCVDPRTAYEKIYNVDIYEGIMGSAQFMIRIKDVFKCAFLFRPIDKYCDEIETLLAVTSTKVWQLVNYIRPIKQNGEVDYTAANMLLKLHDKLVDRKMGTVKHLIEMKKIQMNVNTGSIADDLEAIDAQIQSMEKTPVEIQSLKRNALTKETGVSD